MDEPLFLPDDVAFEKCFQREIVRIKQLFKGIPCPRLRLEIVFQNKYDTPDGKAFKFELLEHPDSDGTLYIGVNTDDLIQDFRSRWRLIKRHS